MLQSKNCPAVNNFPFAVLIQDEITALYFRLSQDENTRATATRKIMSCNIINEFYAKDTSKKIRAVKRSKGMAGEHIGSHPHTTT